MWKRRFDTDAFASHCPGPGTTGWPTTGSCAWGPWESLRFAAWIPWDAVGLHQGRAGELSGWWFQTWMDYFPWSMASMGCHPNPIDELHHFSRWLLHHQADYDNNAPKDPGTPLKFCEKPYGFSRRFQDFGKRGTTHFGRSRHWMWHRTPVWRSGGVLEQHQQSGFQAKSSDRWIQFRFQVRGQWSDVDNSKIIWLVVWNMFLFFHILGIMIPTDFHSIIFQRDQPPTSNYY